MSYPIHPHSLSSPSRCPHRSGEPCFRVVGAGRGEQKKGMLAQEQCMHDWMRTDSELLDRGVIGMLNRSHLNIEDKSVVEHRWFLVCQRVDIVANHRKDALLCLPHITHKELSVTNTLEAVQFAAFPEIECKELERESLHLEKPNNLRVFVTLQDNELSTALQRLLVSLLELRQLHDVSPLPPVIGQSHRTRLCVTLHDAEGLTLIEDDQVDMVHVLLSEPMIDSAYR